MAYQAKNVKLSYTGSKILPVTDSAFIKYNAFKKTFGEDGSVMVVGIQSPDIFKKEVYNQWVQLSNDIQKLKGIKQVLSSGRIFQLEKDGSYPQILKFFTQFVLIPLLLIYVTILYFYAGKILINWELPRGWVSYLILIFSLFGLLSFLLVHPIAQKKENLWIYSFNRWFYFVLIPLIGLLFWAILYRINLYGITHGRYYVLLLASCGVLQHYNSRRLKPVKFCRRRRCIRRRHHQTVALPPEPTELVAAVRHFAQLAQNPDGPGRNLNQTLLLLRCS